MAIFSVNKTTRSVTIHKVDCKHVPTSYDNIKKCGDQGYQTGKVVDKHVWFTEETLSTKNLQRIFGFGTIYRTFLCSQCWK